MTVILVMLPFVSCCIMCYKDGCHEQKNQIKSSVENHQHIKTTDCITIKQPQEI